MRKLRLVKGDSSKKYKLTKKILGVSSEATTEFDDEDNTCCCSEE